MNDTIKKINFFDSSQKFIKNYYKRILILVAILLAFFLIFQIYVVYTNKQILKTSIEFNLAQSSNSPSDFQEQMNRLSSQKILLIPFYLRFFPRRPVFRGLNTRFPLFFFILFFKHFPSNSKRH